MLQKRRKASPNICKTSKTSDGWQTKHTADSQQSSHGQTLKRLKSFTRFSAMHVRYRTSESGRRGRHRPRPPPPPYVRFRIRRFLSPVAGLELRSAESTRLKWLERFDSPWVSDLPTVIESPLARHLFAIIQRAANYPLVTDSALQLAVTNLLRRLLTSGSPSRCLSTSVALRQTTRPPRVRRATFPLIPVGFTSWRSVQVLGFESNGPLTPPCRLVSASCSSGQRFAFSFLQIPPRDGHPCRSASTSPCRACRGLSPPSHPASTTCTGTAPYLAHYKKPRISGVCVN